MQNVGGLTFGVAFKKASPTDTGGEAAFGIFQFGASDFTVLALWVCIQEAHSSDVRTLDGGQKWADLYRV